MKWFSAVALKQFLLLTLVPLTVLADDTDSVSVTTPLGDIDGVISHEVEVFKGIPYATAPVGDLRWRPPQPVKAWSETKRLDATEFGADCPQPAFGGHAPERPQSEDCLFLNIWRPAGTKPGDNLPVMVWIHGGAFVFGSGANSLFAGVSFAKQQVMLVTINYRLGRFGHFAFPALTTEDPESPTGSYAYMDQIQALQWIQSYISRFGGDQNNVTVFGESAGGVSVHSLLTIPSAKGLFHKAIIQSGGGRDGVLTGRPLSEDGTDRHYPVSAETIGINFAIKHNIGGTGPKALAALRALSTEQVLDSGSEFDDTRQQPIYSGPILDGQFVVTTAEGAYQESRQSKVPLLIGSNTAEVPAGFVNAESKPALWQQFGDFSVMAQQAYDVKSEAPLAEVLSYVNTDKVWAEPARYTARAFAAAGTPVFVYRFGYIPESLHERFPYGASHASEIAYVFNTLQERRGIDTVSDKDRYVADMMHRYWIQFAKTGNPNSADTPQWAAFNINGEQMLIINKTGKAASMSDPTKARIDVIEKAVEAKATITKP